MAAGPITLIIKESQGYPRLARFWSSDGTPGGSLTPIHQLDADQLAEVTDALAPLGTEATLQALLAKVIAAPATSAKQDTIIASLATIDGHVDGLEATSASILAKLSSDPATQTTLAAVLAKLSSDPATQTTLAAVLAKLPSDPATDTKLEAVRALLAGTLTAAPSTDQDPIFDHANGVSMAVTASTVVFTPPAGCKFARFDATVDTFIRTDNQAAADDGKAIRLIAGQPEILPVTATVAVRAYAASSSTLRITPMKVR